MPSRSSARCRLARRSTSRGSTRSRPRGRTTSPRTCPGRRWSAAKSGLRGLAPRRLDEIRITLNAGREADDRAGRSRQGRLHARSSRTPAAARRLNARYGAGKPEREGRAAALLRERRWPSSTHLIFNTSRGAVLVGSPASCSELRARPPRARAPGPVQRAAGTPHRRVPARRPCRASASVRIYPLATRPRARPAARWTSAPDGGALHVRLSVLTSRFAEIVKANLRAIGIDVQIKNFGDSIFARIRAARRALRHGPRRLVRRLPASVRLPPPAGRPDHQGDDNVNWAYFDDPEYNRRLDAAMSLASPAREVALGRLADDVARTAAPWPASRTTGATTSSRPGSAASAGTPSPAWTLAASASGQARRSAAP